MTHDFGSMFLCSRWASGLVLLWARSNAPSLPLKDVHRGITCPAQEGRLSRNGLRTHRLESPLEQARHASNARVVPFPSDVTPRGLPPCHAHRAMQAYTEPR